MRIIYNNLIPFPGYMAIMLFGIIFARKRYKPLSSVAINHEAIHQVQAGECNGYLGYYCRYLALWFRHGYKGHPMENEACRYESDLNYLKTRKPFAWR